VRAADFEVLNEPKPGHAIFSSFWAALVTMSKKAATVRSASALVTPASVAMASISSAWWSCDLIPPGTGLLGVTDCYVRVSNTFRALITST